MGFFDAKNVKSQAIRDLVARISSMDAVVPSLLGFI
jgi:hypothetical protein